MMKSNDGNHMLHSFEMIVVNYFYAALTIGFDPRLEKYLEGHMDMLHPLEDLIKSLKPY